MMDELTLFDALTIPDVSGRPLASATPPMPSHEAAAILCTEEDPRSDRDWVYVIRDGSFHRAVPTRPL